MSKFIEHPIEHSLHSDHPDTTQSSGHGTEHGSDSAGFSLEHSEL